MQNRNRFPAAERAQTAQAAPWGGTKRRHLFDAPRYAENGRPHHRVPDGEAGKPEGTSELWEEEYGAWGGRGGGGGSHGYEAGVLGSLISFWDLESDTKRTVDVDLLRLWDHMVWGALGKTSAEGVGGQLEPN